MLWCSLASFTCGPSAQDRSLPSYRSVQINLGGAQICWVMHVKMWWIPGYCYSSTWVEVHLQPPPLLQNGSLSGSLLIFIHFSQSNGLWRSDAELNNPEPVLPKTRSSAVYMLTPLNRPPKCLHDSIFFAVDDDRIEFPQSGCPFPVCVWRVAAAAGEFRPTFSFT